MYASSSQVLNQGVMQDYVEAVKWFRKAADQGNADAQAALGGIYGAGQGCPPGLRGSGEVAPQSSRAGQR
jgi:TPR repeat protein